ncbi:MAG: hypothetical protein RLZ52_426 [Pseudomonadota bacterium]
MSNKIFLAITSANEKNLRQTVDSAIHNSSGENLLTFGIFDLCMNGFPKTNFSDLDNVIYMPMEFNGTQGIGLARLITSSIIFQDTDYVLQLDSHMIFTKNWDKILISNYNNLESKYSKPIISSRCPQWEYDLNGKIIIDNQIVEDTNNVSLKLNKLTSKLVFRDYWTALIQDGYPTIEGIDAVNVDYIEHNLISAQFTFSRPDIYFEILHDPRLPWGGDEPIYSLRAWTRGYRMFSIKDTLCFHYNKKTMGGAYGKDDQNDWRNLKNNDKRLFKFYLKRYEDGKKIMKDILTGEYVGYWGAPSLNKLKEFEEACGVDFKKFYGLKNG